MQKTKSAKMIPPHLAHIVPIDSPVLPEDEARNKDFAKLLRQEISPRLPYDMEALARDGVSQVQSHPRLEYNIPALPGRQSYHITDKGKDVLPTTGAQALGYYGVRTKGGTNISGLSAKMIPVIGEMASAARDLRLPQRVITAGSDGEHKRGSLHYRNRALDFRGNDISDAQGRKLARLVQTRLGQDYEVFFEQPDRKPPEYDHFHIEFDPPAKRR